MVAATRRLLEVIMIPVYCAVIAQVIAAVEVELDLHVEVKEQKL